MSANVTVARQMVEAEFLRLRKKRGFMALVLAVVVAPLVIWTGYQVIEHASNPAAYGPAGGLEHYARMLSLLGVFMGPVAAVLIGAEAGAGDLATGVFRDNVLTGRSRMALFLARIPAALAVTFTVIAIGVASLTGSRPGTITALIGWELVLSPLLVQSASLGSARHGLLDGVLLFLKPGPIGGAPL